MNCNEAAEFVSALCDGETVPAEAAEHIGGCSSCRAHLQEYLAMGAELRRVASLEPAEEVRVRGWSSNQRRKPTWWTKGWESMRIPRFAFVLLIVAIITMGSSLVVLKAKARTEGNVINMTVSLPDGQVLHCFASLVAKRDGCSWLATPRYLFAIEILSHSSDRIELGIRERFNSPPFKPEDYLWAWSDLQSLPQKSYSFHPGDKLKIDIPGAGALTVQGELTDHIPPFPDETIRLEPEAGELRVTSPLLLRGDKVVADLGAMSSIQKDRAVVQMYMPGQGLWVVSLKPFEGAVEAKVMLSRVKFEMKGQAYTFLMAAPVSRSDRIWIGHDPNYKPADPNLRLGFMGGIDMDHLDTRLRFEK